MPHRARSLSPSLGWVAGLLLCSACATASQPVRITRTVEPGPVRAVDVALAMSTGSLQMHSGQCDLVHTDIRYDAEDTSTRVRYRVREARGELVVEERRAGRARRDVNETRWDLCFGPDTPLYMRVDIGAGNGDLQLAGLDLRSLSLDIGTGNAEIDLRGEFRTDLFVRIDGGVGNIVVRVPSATGVRVTADKGVGNITAPGFRHAEDRYTNAVYGTTPRSIDIKVDVGVGNVSLYEG